MLEYLPELMKGLHTSLTLTLASLIVALVLSLLFTVVLALKTPCSTRWLKALSPCLPARRCWCRFFDLLRPWSVSQYPANSMVVASSVAALALCDAGVIAKQCRLHYSALLWGGTRDPLWSVAILCCAGNEPERYAAYSFALRL